ncbi:MAG TPA: hypothetical protein VE547_05070 [Mycobacteriales bacterium]|nr:hypothetical protein [Mycobacteriales bacterium]
MVVLRRRTVLGLAGAGAGALAAAGCTAAGGPAATPAPTIPPPPDPLLAELADELTLTAAYAATVARHPALASRLTGIRDDHVEHADALRRELDAAGAPAPTRSPAPPRPVPASPAAALAALRAAERAAAAARGAVALAAPGDRAGLLASIAACETSHLRVLR